MMSDGINENRVEVIVVNKGIRVSGEIDLDG